MYDNQFTPRAQNALRLAQAAAEELGHSYVGSEHLLLGLLREEGGAAHRCLAEQSVTAEKARDAIVRIIGAGLPGLAPPQGLTPRDASGHSLTKYGKFNFDLGNGSGVFFFRKSMLPALKENKFKIQTSRDKSGKIVGQGIFAGYCKIGEKSNTGFSIGITNKIEDTDELGCVGPSFFKNGIVVLDPNNHLIYYR